MMMRRRSAGSRLWLTGCLTCPSPPLHLAATTGSATSVVRTPSHQVAFAVINLGRPYSAPPVNHKRLFVLPLMLPLLSLSATYQKIKPLTSRMPALKSLEKGSNYCVTLVVGDKSSDSQAPSRSSDPPLLTLAGWQQEANGDSAPRSYASLPRPCNKSVFKRFFGKRDLWGVKCVYVSKFLLTNKRFWNHYQCAAHMSTATTNYYWLYLWY